MTSLRAAPSRPFWAAASAMKPLSDERTVATPIAALVDTTLPPAASTAALPWAALTPCSKTTTYSRDSPPSAGEVATIAASATARSESRPRPAFLRMRGMRNLPSDIPGRRRHPCPVVPYVTRTLASRARRGAVRRQGSKGANTPAIATRL